MKRLAALLAAVGWGLGALAQGVDNRVPFADPSILYHNGYYYAYGTHSKNGIDVARSRDLKTWQGQVGRAKGHLALHKEDVYGESRFWAPEVYRVKDRFIMYYSADLHVCAAVADHPLGPFTQQEKRPIFPDFEGIDNSLFIDQNGKGWMTFVRFDNGNVVWSVEMSDDYLRAKPETLRFCFRATQPWELKMGSINEGLFVTRYRNRYFMTYSGNDFRSQDYGIGCAVATDMKGPWRKVADNPLLHSCNGLVGIGHSAMFRDKNGNLKIVFHAHNSTTSVQPRRMYIADVSFRDRPDGEPEMVIDKRFITARYGKVE
ncbi:MAG: glycoside hydrolase family 43 protein [Kiritimatiellae bacterium]|nr:glycoside hydrolase family 43 protein [Kiritimatiellia bacterium]